MKKYFFIFCLPRSGSAWLSTFLTGRDSFCFHDILADHASFDDVLSRMNRRPESVVGIVDTSAYRGAHYVRAQMPTGTEFYCIDRNVIDIQAASDRYQVDYNAHEEYGVLLNATEDAWVINYHQFSSMAYLRALWSEIIGQPFDVERSNQLREMNITRDVLTYFRERPHLRSLVHLQQ